MKVLIVGAGGREHSLAWALARSPRVDHLYCAPGNAGIGEVAELVDIGADDIAGLTKFAKEQRIDLTVPGPELPLTLGIIDELEKNRLRGFGPNRAGAELEERRKQEAR